MLCPPILVVGPQARTAWLSVERGFSLWVKDVVWSSFFSNEDRGVLWIEWVDGLCESVNKLFGGIRWKLDISFARENAEDEVSNDNPNKARCSILSPIDVTSPA